MDQLPAWITFLLTFLSSAAAVYTAIQLGRIKGLKEANEDLRKRVADLNEERKSDEQAITLLKDRVKHLEDEVRAVTERGNEMMKIAMLETVPTPLANFMLNEIKKPILEALK